MRVIHDDGNPAVLTPGHVSDDPIEQARYDALFASMSSGLVGMSGLGPAAGNAPTAQVRLEPVPQRDVVGVRRRIRDDITLTPPIVDTSWPPHL